MIALVLVASRLHLPSSTMKGFESEPSRSSFETAFEEKCVRPVFDAEIAATVIAVQAEIDPTGDIDSCRVALGVLWDYVASDSGPDEKDSMAREERERQLKLEAERTPAEKAAAKAASAAHKLAWLWRPAPDASLRLFKLDFGSSSSASKRYPLIASLLKHERRLPLVSCIADVLRWHAVLFRALRSGIRRDEAAELSNAAAIERLPADQQGEAWEALHAYCDAFNSSFVLVERLFECQENPYLYEDGETGEVEIDLSGAGGQATDAEPMVMSPSISVLYSLPSMVAGAQDADGLCTVQLCNVLSAAHNELMGVLQVTVAVGTPLGEVGAAGAAGAAGAMAAAGAVGK